MLPTIRAGIAAAAVALAGLGGAGTAAAKAAPLGPATPGVHLCAPQLGKSVHALGVRRIGLRYYRVIGIDTIRVNRLCVKRVVASRLVLVPLPFYAAPRAGA